MFLLKPADLILKDHIDLYNNIATTGDCVGRLSAELQVFPSPRISWEFETLGESSCQPGMSISRLDDPLVGSSFFIDKPFISNRSWMSGQIGQQGVRLAGPAPAARLGRNDLEAHSLAFYLPNARFQETNLLGQRFLTKTISANNQKLEADLPGSTAGRFVEFTLDNTWSIRLEIRQDALNWLSRNANNVGTLLTTSGEMFHRKTNESTLTPSPKIRMEDALRLFDRLSLLMSFANGGYLGPVYIEGLRQENKEFEVSALVRACRVTPIEQLGVSWLTTESDLKAYLECIGTLTRMLDSQVWKEDFGLVLIWYFQVIQPMNAQIRGKPWPVVANALGAVLERLCVMILVNELGIRGLQPNQRIETLLQKIGVTESRGYSDVEYVQKFLDIRNDATHPRPGIDISDEERNRIIQRAIMWIEETILWRMGYSGKYLDRTGESIESTAPRYDLASRAPSW